MYFSFKIKQQILYCSSSIDLLLNQWRTFALKFSGSTYINLNVLFSGECNLFIIYLKQNYLTFYQFQQMKAFLYIKLLVFFCFKLCKLIFSLILTLLGLNYLHEQQNLKKCKSNPKNELFYGVFISKGVIPYDFFGILKI